MTAENDELDAKIIELDRKRAEPRPSEFSDEALALRFAERHAKNGAPQSTVEALMYELRTWGLAALAGANCRGRLVDLLDPQLGQVIERLMALRPLYPAITDELLVQLEEVLR